MRRQRLSRAAAARGRTSRRGRGAARRAHRRAAARASVAATASASGAAAGPAIEPNDGRRRRRCRPARRRPCRAASAPCTACASGSSAKAAYGSTTPTSATRTASCASPSSFGSTARSSPAISWSLRAYTASVPLGGLLPAGDANRQHGRARRDAVQPAGPPEPTRIPRAPCRGARRCDGSCGFECASRRRCRSTTSIPGSDRPRRYGCERSTPVSSSAIVTPCRRSPAAGDRAARRGRTPCAAEQPLARPTPGRPRAPDRRRRRSASCSSSATRRADRARPRSRSSTREYSKSGCDRDARARRASSAPAAALRSACDVQVRSCTSVA